MAPHLAGEVEVLQEPLNEIARVARAAVSVGVADPAVVAAVSRPAPLERGGEAEEAAEESVWESVRRFLSGTSLRVVDRQSRRLRWPLFFVGCPEVKNAETGVIIRASATQNRSWILKLSGTGFDRYTSLSQADTHRATAVAGQQRLIYIECAAEAVDYVLLQPGRDPVPGTRLELDGATRPTVGVVDLGTPAWPWRAPARTVERLNYKDALPDGRQEWGREEGYTCSTNLLFGIDTLAVSIGTSLGYELSTTVVLHAALPGGVDWRVMAPERCPGVFVESA